MAIDSFEKLRELVEGELKFSWGYDQKYKELGRLILELDERINKFRDDLKLALEANDLWDGK